jgi:N-acetylmuramoyl-L-alanine amidase
METPSQRSAEGICFNRYHIGFPRTSSCLRASAIVVLIIGLFASPARATTSEIDVWVDPGHGGTEIGTHGFNGDAPPNEKDITFPIADRVELTLFGLGFFCVHKTRNSDRTLTFKDRALIANGELANDEPFTATCRLFVSIHLNDGPATAFGTETYYARSKPSAKDPKLPSDSSAASEIHADLLTYANVAFGPTCHRDRSVRQANFWVLKHTTAPAVLVEICFLTNECQYYQIIQKGWQNYLGDGIASGISGYLDYSTCEPFGVDPLPETSAALSPSFDDPSHQQAGRERGRLVPALVRTPITALAEDFEGATFPPAGWMTQSAGLPVPHKWHRTTDPDYVGSGSASAYVGSASPSAIDEWLISPPVVLGATDDAIKFSWSGNKYWTGAVNATMSVRLAGTTTWTQLWSMQTDEPNADPFIYRERIVDVAAWEEMSVEFGFRVSGTNGASFGLDDVMIGDFIATGTPVNDVCGSASSLTGVFSVQGLTCYAANDLNPYTAAPGSCVNSDLSGPDVFYELSASWGDTLHASVAADWNAGLYLVNDCLTPVCVAGEFSEDGRAQDVLTHRFAPGGTYYLVVDGAEGSCGPFTLSGRVVSSPTGVQPGITTGMRLSAYPNPANGPVRLFATFASSPGAKPVLEIFDVAGRRLQCYVGLPDSGNLSFVWDGRDKSGRRVASGIYFARIQVGDASVVQKFTILR